MGGVSLGCCGEWRFWLGGRRRESGGLERTARGRDPPRLEGDIGPNTSWNSSLSAGGVVRNDGFGRGGQKRKKREKEGACGS